MRLRDRKLASGCRLAPRACPPLAALVRKRMASGEAVCREKDRRREIERQTEGERERERERMGEAEGGKVQYTRQARLGDTQAQRSITSATEIYRLNNAVDNYAWRTWSKARAEPSSFAQRSRRALSYGGAR